MVEAYPPTLPQHGLMTGYSETPMDALETTTMSVGPPKSRPRSTSRRREVSVSMVLTTAEKNTLLDFYEDTLGQGSLEFQKVDFAAPGGVIYVYKFRDRPSVKPISTTRWSAELLLWRLRVA